MKTSKFNKEVIIYSPFSPNNQVFVIKKGYIFASTLEENGKQRIHLLYGPGAYFPIITVFKNTEQRATYYALTEAEAEIYDKTEFLGLLQNDHQFCQVILDKTVAQLALFADRIIDLQMTKLEERLATRLKGLAKEHGTVEGNSLRLPYLLRHHHLADMLGVERESITRCLATLKERRIISIDSAGHILLRGDRNH